MVQSNLQAVLSFNKEWSWSCRLFELSPSETPVPEVIPSALEVVAVAGDKVFDMWKPKKNTEMKAKRDVVGWGALRDEEREDPRGHDVDPSPGPGGDNGIDMDDFEAEEPHPTSQ